MKVSTKSVNVEKNGGLNLKSLISENSIFCSNVHCSVKIKDLAACKNSEVIIICS